MDKEFLQFWGNLLLNAAQNQKRLDEVTEWMQQGYTGFDELTSLFQKTYGLEKSKEESPDYLKGFAGAQENFTKSFKEYLAVMGVVPHAEHLALVKKYEELKAKVESQEETIRHLRMLLSQASQEEYQDLAGHVEGLVKKQGEHFQKLMDSFAQAFTKENT